jgi:hypothetical protein
MRRRSITALATLVIASSSARADSDVPEIPWQRFTLTGGAIGVAGGVGTFLLGAGIGMFDGDSESFLLITGISGALGLAVGALLAPAFPNRQNALGPTQKSSFTLHTGVTRFIAREGILTNKLAFDARLLYPLRLLPHGSIGVSCTYTTFEHSSPISPPPRDEVIVIGPDARFADFDAVVDPYASVGIKYITSETSSGSGERQRTLGAQLALGLRIRPGHSRYFGELEGRYVQGLVKLAGSTQYRMAGVTAGLGLQW